MSDFRSFHGRRVLVGALPVLDTLFKSLPARYYFDDANGKRWLITEEPKLGLWKVFSEGYKDPDGKPVSGGFFTEEQAKEWIADFATWPENKASSVYAPPVGGGGDFGGGGASGSLDDPPAPVVSPKPVTPSSPGSPAVKPTDTPSWFSPALLFGVAGVTAFFLLKGK